MAAQAFRLVARVGGREFRAQLVAEMLVGSGPDCAFVLPDPTVSRRHARLTPTAGGVQVEDLGSRNGTSVDGRRIAEVVQLAPGSRLVLGEVELRVEPLAAGDVGPALGAGPGPGGSQPPHGHEPTLASAGLTRFCVRALEPLLARLADGAGFADLAVEVLGELAQAAPGSGFRLLRKETGAVLASAGEAGDAAACVERGGLVLEVASAGDAASPGLRTLASLGLSLLCASRQHQPGGRAEARTAAAAPVVAPLETASPALREIYWKAARVAPSRLNVLLVGESGTGKELLARYLHEASGEPDDRFLVLNCAALPSDLLDAELFGIEAGVATGVAARAGRFELAHGGTLFLDEIGDMSLDTQARILRVLQEREVYRVGSHRARPADVRVVSATHRDLDAMVREGQFRLDLLHRIADWRAELPPLRARREDIGNLAARFLAAALARRGLRPGGLSQATLDALVRYPWPGNVRELEREMARVALFVEDGEVVVSSMLKPAILAAGGEDHGAGLSAQLEREERRIIAGALADCGGQVALAAERLGVSRATLYRRLQQLGLATVERSPAG